MHRSGTSALTGTLEETGIYLGHVVRTTPDNPKGYCENPTVFLMHENLLRVNGGSATTPPEVCRWHTVHELIRDTIVDSFRGHPLWGFKDPRTLFTLDGWLRVLPHAQLIGIFRHPTLVAASLKRRDQRTDEGDAMQTWVKYNRKLLHWHNRYEFPLISFDDLDICFEQQLEILSKQLELPCVPKLNYYERRFRHITESNRVFTLPPDVGSIYEALISRWKASYRTQR